MNVTSARDPVDEAAAAGSALLPAAPLLLAVPACEVDLAADEAAVRRAQGGDGEAFGEIYDRHSVRLYRHILHPGCGGETALAQDLLQETFLKALEGLDRFAWAPHGIFPWLRTIAFNVLRDHWRRRGQAERGSRLMRAMQLEEETPQEKIEHRESLRQRVSDTLVRLNERYRRALTGRFLEGRAPEVCARDLGVKRSTFDVILHRACKAFRAAFEPAEELP